MNLLMRSNSLMLQASPFATMAKSRAITGFTPMRSMSTATTVQPDAIDIIRMLKTEFMMNNARVKIALPTQEEVWFFIKKETTVADLREMVQTEDPTAEIFNALDRPSGCKLAPTQLADDVNLYEHIQCSESEIILQLNDNFFEMMTAKPLPIDITFTTPYLEKMQEVGITSVLHKSSINTVIT